MSYKINTTNGALLVDLIDGRIDDETTDLILIGRNYTGYGEAFNENFVKVLENFANTAAPSNPLVGQLWYDTSEVRLKVYNGQSFIATAATIVSSTAPLSLAAGELWVDTANKQLKFSDGSNTFLAGPIYTVAQGKSGLDVETLVDEFGNSKVVVRLLIAAQPVAIISRESFNMSTAIPNFDTEIKEGINISSLYPDFLYHGTAESALSLSGISATGFLRTNPESAVVGNTTTGILKIQTNLGLTVGDNNDFKLLISNNNTVLRNQTGNAGIKFQVNTGPTVSEDFLTDYLTVNTIAGNVGIWQDNPQYNLDVFGDMGITGNLVASGDVRITGSLVVEGATTSIDVATLRVEDKNIELGITSTGVLLTDVQADEGGIQLKVDSSDKEFIWRNASNSWTSSTNIDLAAGLSYKIGSNDVLSDTTLAVSVDNALGLTRVGTLQYLDVDDIRLNDSTISTTANPLSIVSNGAISVNSQRIIDIADPIDPQDVASKIYVDTRSGVSAIDIAFSLDVTGLTNSSIETIIESMVSSTTKDDNVEALIHCTEYSGTNTYNASDGISKTFVTVDKAGTENQSVLVDILFNNATNTLALTVTRTLKRFRVVTGSWTYIEDVS
jgi:hypothetical protein